MIKVLDALEWMRSQPSQSVDLIYSDPPYALGSQIVIKSDGKPDYARACDFMNRWAMPDGQFWEDFFKECFRVLKFGGYCMLFGMDRQNFLFKYYATLSGLQGRQSLYWFYLSNFPKATNLSKMIDKRLKIDREVVGQMRSAGYLRDKGGGDGWGERIGTGDVSTTPKMSEVTMSNSELGKKYEGFRYSISPLKQTLEEIMVFQKPYKSNSCLQDVLDYEAGDAEISVSALNIEGNRIETFAKSFKDNRESKIEECYGDYKGQDYDGSMGRYPSQTFVTTETSVLLDNQSSSNCSKILEKCDYESDEMDLLNYAPKVSPSERNSGLEDFPITNENRELAALTHAEGREGVSRNPHPCLKPINLTAKILKLFKTPNPQRILIPFAGSGSEVIGAIKAGFTDIEGCEINEEYVEVAKSRIKYWTKPKGL